MARENRAAFCPGCERFIGPADTCPYCECDSARKPLLRILRAGAVILALAGLAVLHVMATHGEAPLIRISEITPMMNFGWVRIQGVVEKDVAVSRRKGRVDSVSYTVEDGTGSIRVVAYGMAAQALVDHRRLPGGKTRVDLTGNLNVSADGNTKLILRGDHALDR